MIKIERCKRHDWLEFFSLTAPLTCAAVGRPEDQAGKCFTCHESAQVSRTSMHIEPLLVLLAAWGWCHALCTQAIIHPDTGEKIFMPFRMSGTTSDEDLSAKAVWSFSIVCQRVSYTDSHFSACAGYVPFGTPIVSPHMKSRTFLIFHAFHRS